MTECVFCALIESRAEVLEELPTAVLLRDQFPVTEGHLLALPKRHTEAVFELSDNELCDVWSLLKTGRAWLARDDPSVQGFNVGVNVGAVAGQTIPHVHVHLIPRRVGDIDDPRGGVRGVIPDRMKY